MKYDLRGHKRSPICLYNIHPYLESNLIKTLHKYLYYEFIKFYIFHNMKYGLKGNEGHIRSLLCYEEVK